MASPDACSVLSLLVHIMHLTFVALWQTVETMLNYILYKNRLLCWLKLVATLTFQVLNSLVMAGVTLCVCTYFMLTESGEHNADDKGRTMQENVCDILRCTDICSILQRNNCACACGCCGLYRLPFVTDCDLPLVANCELPNVFDEFDASGLLAEDVYCFDKCGRGHDSLETYKSCGLSSLRKLENSDNRINRTVEFIGERKNGRDK